MKFSAAFLTAALASLVVAQKSSPLAERINARQEGLDSIDNRHVQKRTGSGSTDLLNDKKAKTARNKVELSYNWSGATLLVPSYGWFTHVTGTFTLPKPLYVGQGPGAYAYVWIGIDGYSCEAALTAGMVIQVSKTGEVSYAAQYSFNDNAGAFSDLHMKPGDIIQMEVSAPSTTIGIVKITNHSTGKSATKKLTPGTGPALCRWNAQWIVEDPSLNGRRTTLTNFGEILFTDVSAGQNTGVTMDLTKALLWEIEIDIGKTSHIVTHSNIVKPDQLSVVYVTKH
ncbi:hypothetical protein ACEQ8H_004162 [Pleosporales sp. CAS-2024a]